METSGSQAGTARVKCSSSSSTLEPNERVISATEILPSRELVRVSGYWLCHDMDQAVHTSVDGKVALNPGQYYCWWWGVANEIQRIFFYQRMVVSFVTIDKVFV